MAREDGNGSSTDCGIDYHEHNPEPIADVLEANEKFQERDLGAVTFSGLCGYHTFFNHDDGVRFAVETALHQALEATLQEAWVGPEIVEDNHGEFTVESAATELELQLDDIFHMDRFKERFVEEFEDALQQQEAGLREAKTDE